MKWLAMALALGVCHCGDEAETIVLLEVDSRSIVPSPTSLHLTLAAPSGDSIAHTSPVDADGQTRIALIVGERTPDAGTLEIIAYTNREVVARAGPAPYEAKPNTTTTLRLALE